MEKWTQEELEELYKKVNKKAAEDPEFLEKLKKDVRGTMEEFSGRKLPEGLELEVIEAGSAAANAYMMPDFSGDEVDLNELKNIPGGAGKAPKPVKSGGDDEEPAGISAVLVVSVCVAAVGVGPCVGDVNVTSVCVGDVCMGAICTANICTADITCAGNICGSDVCGAYVVCLGDMCGADVCGAQTGCNGNLCGGNYCAKYGHCTDNTCGKAV